MLQNMVLLVVSYLLILLVLAIFKAWIFFILFFYFFNLIILITGQVYPEGPWATNDTVQRGTVMLSDGGKI